MAFKFLLLSRLNEAFVLYFYPNHEKPKTKN